MERNDMPERRKRETSERREKMETSAGALSFGLTLLFALLIIRGYYLAMHMRDRFSFLVTAGITTLLAIQVILNVAVVTNLAPCTGISLPFFSYGGTALMIQLGEMGIILSASREIPAKT